MSCVCVCYLYFNWKTLTCYVVTLQQQQQQKNSSYARKILEKKKIFRNVKHDDIKLGQMQFGACVLSYQHYCVIYVLLLLL